MKAKDIISVVTVVLCIAAAAWMPSLGTLFTLTGTVVCALLYVRRGWYPVILCASLGAAAVFGLTRSLPAVIVLPVGVVVPGSAMMAVWKKKFGMREIITAGTLGFLVQTLLEFIMIRVQTGKNVFSEMLSVMQTEIEAMMPQFRDMLGTADAAKAEESIQLLTQLYHSFLETAAQLVPAILVVCSCALAYAALCVCAAFLRRGGEDTDRITPFTELHAPRSVTLAVLAAFALSTFVPQQAVRGAALNITAVLFAYFVVCGISLLCFFVKRLFPRPFLRLLIAASITLILLSMLTLPVFNPMQMFLLAGILDSAFCFRRRVRQTDAI